MSGLVTGLQNRLERFDSARYLDKDETPREHSSLFFCGMKILNLFFNENRQIVDIKFKFQDYTITHLRFPNFL